MKKLEKFDKNIARVKVQSLTWFLCYEETINHIWTNLNVKTKNCKQEDWDKVVYFKVKWNSIYKVVDKEEIEVIKIHKKPTTEKIWDFIINNTINNYKNILDRTYCKYLKLIKKDIFKNDEYKEVFIIQPVWEYKKENDKQLKKDPNTISCEWFYPDSKRFFIYDINHTDLVLEVKNDILINFDSLKFN
jgi:hypothetical protein